MKKVIRLTESDLMRIVKRVIMEDDLKLFGARFKKDSNDTPEILDMYKSGETTGTWHFDDVNKRLCIEAKKRRSFCFEDSELYSDFDSKKFKKGEKGNFEITSEDGKIATMVIK